ncbi:hypothetical protein EII15_20160 [Bacillus licheniformis]|uniref:pLS20_p028 family conjugation system transmembrane protein n=1 Tax=Bacillus licheniformis TaxID=1402 RepID=UPI000F5EDF12|nr:hypothetical protein [Bacillus licheniformis]RRD96031.1 hypothetical protein EII15_20160 [Bacillus licheniformis]
MSAQDILEKFGDMLHVTNVISSIFRQIGEWLLNGLLFVNSIVEKVTMSILTSTDFFQYGPLKDLRNEMAPLIWSLMGLTVILIGFQLMFNKIEKRHNVVLNGLIAVLFIVGGPTMMDLLNKISTNAINDLDHAGAETAGQKIVKNNLADVNYYARQGFEVKKLPDEQRYNNISADNIKYIHFTEVVNLDGVKGEAKEALNNQLVVNDDNKIEMKKLDDGWFGVGKQEYYRWDLNWAVVLVSLLVTVVALIVTIVKVGRIIFDLGFHGIFGTLIAATDISGGQRLKKVINEIFSSYAVLFIMCLLLKIYTLYTGWVGAKDFGWAGWGSMLALLAGSWALIDSPNLVERVLGIDAGLGSGWKTLVSAAAVTKMAGSFGKGAVGAAGYVKDKVAQGVGAAQGMKDAVRENVPSLNQTASNGKNENGALNDDGNNGAQNGIGDSKENSNLRNKQKAPTIPGTDGGSQKRSAQKGNRSSLVSKKASGVYSTDGQGASPDIPMPLNTSAVSDNVPTGQEAQAEKQLHGASGHNPIGEHSTQQAGTNGYDANQNSTIPESTEGIPNTDIIPGLANERNEQIPSMYGAPGTVLKPGNITPTHNYTPIGQSRWMQNMKNAHAMGYNSAYNATNAVFKKFRSINPIGKANRNSGTISSGGFSSSSAGHRGSTNSMTSAPNSYSVTPTPAVTNNQSGSSPSAMVKGSNSVVRTTPSKSNVSNTGSVRPSFKQGEKTQSITNSPVGQQTFMSSEGSVNPDASSLRSVENREEHGNSRNKLRGENE